MVADRHRLRTTFAEDAERYDRARPGYPQAVFADLAARAQLAAGSRILEIGCGTGQATLPLAQQGYRLVAVELGAELAAIARRKLAGFPAVEVVVSAFEDWPLPEEPFDAVVSATAFHWIDPSIRLSKSAAALRPGGTLATVATHHIAGGDERLFAAIQACYECWDPATPPGLRLEPASEIPLDRVEIDRSGYFEAPRFSRYEWDLTYSAESYRDLLLTYSGHRALEPARQSGLLDCVTRLVQTSPAGSVTKRYMTELRTTRKLPRGGTEGI